MFLVRHGHMIDLGVLVVLDVDHEGRNDREKVMRQIAMPVWIR